MKALIVEDSSRIRDVLCRALDALGLEDQVEAGNGKEGLAALARERFDIVLLDWRMPEMDGIEMLHAMRASGDHTPAIMVTVIADRESILHAIAAGANDYLTKPFSLRQLADKIAAVCPAAALTADGDATPPSTTE